jgi:type IV pilus assembly protein PilM
MIQLAASTGHISVVAAQKVRLDPELCSNAESRREFIVSALKKMVSEGGFRGNEVVSCLANEKLKITSLRLAEQKSRDLEESLRDEVSQRFGLDSSEDAIRYMIAGEVRQGDETKNELILLAASSDSVREHIDLMEAADLIPVGIDALPCALFRSFERMLQREEDGEQTAVFVDLGCKYTSVVFGRGRDITFVKQIPIGGLSFDEEIASKLGISISEAGTLRERLRMENSGTNGVEKASESGGDEELSDVESEDVFSEEALDILTRRSLVDAINGVAEKLVHEISLCLRYYTVTFRGKRVEKAFLSGGEAYEQILFNVLQRQLAVKIEMSQPLRGFAMEHIDFSSDRRKFLTEWAVAVGLSLKKCKDSGLLSVKESRESEKFEQVGSYERN